MGCTVLACRFELVTANAGCRVWESSSLAQSLSGLAGLAFAPTFTPAMEAFFFLFDRGRRWIIFEAEALIQHLDILVFVIFADYMGFFFVRTYAR